MKKRVLVQVPASSGNIGPGFDVLGLALNFGNELRVQVLKPKPGKPRVRVRGEGDGQVPLNQKNVIYKALAAVYKKVGRRVPQLDLLCLNKIPLARGLGSSSAAVLSGLLAGNRLVGNRLNSTEILNLATQFEGHPDNVAPALLGGVQASSVVNGSVVTDAWPRPRCHVVVAIPTFPLSTQKARAVLPKKISMVDAVSNLSSVALLHRAFSKEPTLLPFLLNDRWHEPYRARLIPGFYSVKKSALEKGAWGVTLSGAGPTILSFVETRKAKRVAAAMSHAFQRKGIQNQTMILKINSRGAVVR